MSAVVGYRLAYEPDESHNAFGPQRSMKEILVKKHVQSFSTLGKRGVG